MNTEDLRNAARNTYLMADKLLWAANKIDTLEAAQVKEQPNLYWCAKCGKIYPASKSMCPYCGCPY